MASIRVTCVVLMVCMALLSAPMVHGAISCGTVTVSLAPCLAYLQRGGAPPLACCQGVKNVLAGARTPADRKTVCTCLKTSAGQVPGINLANAGSLPSKCEGSDGEDDSGDGEEREGEEEEKIAELDCEEKSPFMVSLERVLIRVLKLSEKWASYGSVFSSEDYQRSVTNGELQKKMNDEKKITSLWLVRATAEAFRVADAPAKVFFLLMKNTEEIFSFCAQIFKFQVQWLLVVAAEVISGYVILCLPFLYVLMFALYDHMLWYQGSLPKAGGFPPLGAHGPFQPTPAPVPTPLAGWMSNPTIVAHAVVSGGATIGLGTAIGLGAPSIPAALKDPRTPPTNPSVDYPSGDSNHVSKRTRPMGMSDEVNLPVNVLSATFPGHGHGQAFNAPYDLPKTIMRTLNQDSSPMSMDFYPVQQTILLVGTNVGDIALWEVGSREWLVLRNFKVWDLSACSMPFQAALIKDPGVSVNRVIWSPDGALFGVAYSKHIVQIYSYHGGGEVRQHLEAYNAFGESCGLVILDVGVNII
ncbi:hypothetical protein AHAS_Ahas12G0196300 [Arachis hypogaea]